MLNIGRMGPGSERYYLDAVARDGATRDGVADYYLARGEEPGRWLGRAADEFGLDGEVTTEQLSRMLDGRDPATGELLGTHPARKVPGFDLTFRAPKSVSLLWGLSGRDTAATVAAAHAAAVDAAIDYLERNAGWTRRGAGGAERVRTTGFVGAAFRHRTSRAGDPLLHTHVLVANLAAAVDDGQWRSLDSRQLYVHARTAGFLYQAHLRDELTRRLGVAWGPVTNGCADLAEVDRRWIEAFSKRRAAIIEHMAIRGETSAKAAQVATLDTRQAKPVQPSEADLRARWRTEASAIGITPDWTERTVGRSGAERPNVLRLYRELVTDEALTEQTSSFTRRDAVRAVAERLPTGAPVDEVEELADAIVAHDPERVIPLGATRGHLTAIEAIRRTDGAVVPADVDEPRFTTRGLLLTEQHAIRHAIGRQHTDAAVVPAALVGRTTGQRTLSNEQAAMVRRLTTSGHGVEVVVGKAGTGKTYALDAARDAWSAAGVRITGVALAARAALELEDAAGIPSNTLARLLNACDDDRVGSPLQPGSVLVVDEAGMVGSRQLARLLARAEARNVKVVLVGDPHQLPEIDAGGLFRALATRLPAIELTDNRRQRHPWEADALDQLRHGDPVQAIDSYRRHGRLVTADSAEELRETLVTDWWETYADPGGDSAIMIALRRSDVDDLNARARARLANAGRLTGPTLDIDGLELQAGDRIMCLRNDRRLGVVNGTCATVTALREGQSLVVRTDDGRAIVLPTDYLDAGHVTHAYAITGHKAQGLTVNDTFVLGSEALYREWGYVGMSRGRRTNRLYVCAVSDDEEWHRHGPRPDVDPVGATAARLSRSRAQMPVTPAVQDLAARWRQLQSRLAAPDIAQLHELVRQRTALLRDLRDTRDSLDRLERRIGRRGPVDRWRNRHLLAQLEHDQTVRTGRLHRTANSLQQIEARMADLPDPHDVDRLREQFRQLTDRLDEATRRRLDAFGATVPAYLATSLGPLPQARGCRAAWIRAATAVEGFRLRWGITDPDRPLGPAATGGRQRLERDVVARTLERTRHELQPPSRRHPVRQRALSR